MLRQWRRVDNNSQTMSRFLGLMSVALLILNSGLTDALDSRLKFTEPKDGKGVTYGKASQELFSFELKTPFSIYDKKFDAFKVYTNGFIALSSASSEDKENLPMNYPQFSELNKDKFETIDGNYISVFSNLMHGSKTGNVSIREMKRADVSKSDENILVRTDKFINEIWKKELGDKTFSTKSLIVVNWNNLSDAKCEKCKKRNTFSVVLLMDEKHSYVLYQYHDIQWTKSETKPELQSLPPQAGVYVTPSGFQLPRSGKKSVPTDWNGETNIGQPGEWLFPLYESSTTYDEEGVQEKLKKLHSDIFKEQEEETDQSWTGMFTDFFNGYGKETPESEDGVKCGDVVCDEEAECITKDDKKQCVCKQGFKGDGTTCEMEKKADEEEEESDEKTELTTTKPFSSSGLRRCEVNNCESAYAKCWEMEKVSSCLCEKGYIGGSDYCIKDDYSDHFRLNLKGSMKLKPRPSASEQSISFSTSIQTDTAKRTLKTQSLIGEVNKESKNLVKMCNPILHIMNSLMALYDPECASSVSGNYTFNMMTLANAFKDEFYFNFKINIENHGDVEAKLTLKANEAIEGKMVIDVKGYIKTMNGFKNVVDEYEEFKGPSQSTGKAYYAKYRINSDNKVVFDEQTVKFKKMNAEENLKVTWSAEAGHTMPSKAFGIALAKSNLREESAYLKYDQSGYCKTECVDKCEILCLDKVAYLTNEPGPCECQICSGVNEKCYPKKNSFICDCKPNYKKDDNGVCMLDGNSTRPTVGEKCGSKNCHVDAKCNDHLKSICQCNPGYRGDGIKECLPDPCSRCAANEECIDDMCVAPPKPISCGGKQCAPYATCSDDNKCKCPFGYFGDGTTSCTKDNIVPRDLCGDRNCHQDATCVDNKCVCGNGFIGDGYNSCEPQALTSTGDCYGNRCGENARCDHSSRRCECMPGYIGNGYTQCVRESLNDNQCGGYTCASNTQCIEDRCACISGYEGDPYREGCQVSRNGNQCGGYTCASNTQCIDGRCACMSGYEGDPYREGCQVSRNQNMCGGYRCASNTQCVDDRCACMSGYEGDPYREGCQVSRNDASCGGYNCASNTQCVDGRCVCNNGYDGDPYGRGCEMSRTLCGGYNCGSNARCENNRCVCNSGYVGNPYSSCTYSRASQKCYGHPCGKNARCDDQAKRCVCLDGYDGYAYEECTRKAEFNGKCGGGYCTENAVCQNDICVCPDGYSGNGYEECRNDIERKICSGSWCAWNAYCNGMRCVCNEGFEGDPYSQCRQLPRDNMCNGRRCGENAYCSNGYCQCHDGYEGDAYDRCQLRQLSSCGNCPYNSECDEQSRECVCSRGYQKDYRGECVRQNEVSSCGNCPYYSECDEQRKECVCSRGYQKDYRGECVRQNEGSVCGNCPAYSRCNEDYQECQCENGYTKDRNGECVRRNVASDCNGKCHSTAVCNANTGECECPPDLQFDQYKTKCYTRDKICGSFGCDDYAICEKKYCSCLPGYVGNAYEIGGCKVAVSTCGTCPANSQCDEPRRECVCVSGYNKDYRGECVRQGSVCGNCPAYSRCDERTSYCECESGYRKDSRGECVREDPYANCGGRRCHENARCNRDRCECEPGYDGNGYDYCNRASKVEPCGDCGQWGTCDEPTKKCICKPGAELGSDNKCKPRTDDNCNGRRCAENAYCSNNYCYCKDGYVGDGFTECNPKRDERPCNGRCGVNARCVNGRCECLQGYTGDPNYECRQTDNQSCDNVRCGANARCQYGRCECYQGYNGDPYSGCTYENRRPCDNVRCGANARCEEGRCVCEQGYEGDANSGCSRRDQIMCNGRQCGENTECWNSRCECKIGYSGNPQYSCTEDPKVPCGRGYCGRGGVCEAGVCNCPSGTTGDPYTACARSAKGCGGKCVANSSCINNQCKCDPGYTGNPAVKCYRSGDSQDEVQVKIVRESDKLYVPSSDEVFELICYISGKDISSKNLANPKWSPVSDRATVTTTVFQTSKQTKLQIKNPKPSDSGVYTCSGDGKSDRIEVTVSEPTGISWPMVMSSDNGISLVNHTNDEVTKARLWRVVNSSKSKPLALAFNCRNERIYYTSDDGKKIMYGKAENKNNKNRDELASYKKKLKAIQVDSASGNIYSLVQNGREMIVTNEGSKTKHTLKGVAKALEDDISLEILSFALNPRMGLMYLGVSNKEMVNKIYIFSMDGKYIEKLKDIEGHPKAMSFSPSANPEKTESAGQLCSLQRIKLVGNPTDKLECLRLKKNGQEVSQVENERKFSADEAPGTGLAQIRNTVFWTFTYARTYQTLKPFKNHLVRSVCCSTRFQTIVSRDTCPDEKSACSSHSCKKFCLPKSASEQTCVCPDGEESCIKE